MTTWYLARGTGAVALLLLTASVVLGVANVRRLQTALLPRFVLDGLHRTVSLLVVVLVALHVLCSVLDSFVSLSLAGALIPFTAGYRPLWLGLGAVAFELLLAIALTSLLRQRIGHRVWRRVHWLAYASWPVALVHGFGAGSDGRTAWMLVLSGACGLAVIAAVLARVAAGWPADRGRRIFAGGVAALSPVVLVLWLLGGPLASGWARRAGTPVALLAARDGPPRAAAGSTSDPLLAAPFTTRVTGRISQSGSSAAVVVRIVLADAAGRRVSLRLEGAPTGSGGIALTAGSARLGTVADPGVYSGPITRLDGGRVTAELSDGSRSLRLDAALQVAGGQVAGTTTVTA